MPDDARAAFRAWVRATAQAPRRLNLDEVKAMTEPAEHTVDPAYRLTLHEYAPSGNCYKIRLTAALLGYAYERRGYDILAGETRTPDFLATVNANGRIPVLQVGDRFLPESNAACWFLAEGHERLWPEDGFAQADVLRWMFWEQYNHEPNVATVRFWLAFVGADDLSAEQRMLLPGKLAAGRAALRLMDDHLATRAWFVGDRMTLADIALYAYTHVAEEGGGFVLADYPHVQGWLARVAGEPDYVGIGD